jgi:hypothetical protein
MLLRWVPPKLTLTMCRMLHPLVRVISFAWLSADTSKRSGMFPPSTLKQRLCAENVTWEHFGVRCHVCVGVAGSVSQCGREICWYRCSVCARCIGVCRKRWSLELWWKSVTPETSYLSTFLYRTDSDCIGGCYVVGVVNVLLWRSGCLVVGRKAVQFAAPWGSVHLDILVSWATGS